MTSIPQIPAHDQHDSTDILTDSAMPLPALPPFAHWLLGQFLAPILAWFSAFLAHHLVRRCAPHDLVRIHQTVDLSPALAVCAAYYHQSGAGSAPTYPVETLLRAELVRALYDTASDYRLEELLTVNLLVRWFVRLPLLPFLTPTPDHTTLNRFHAWLSAHHPDLLHRTVLAFLDRVDPEDPATTPQIVDTFGMQSPAADQSIAVRLMRFTAQLGACWLAAAPATLHPILPTLDWEALRTNRASRGREKAARQLQYAVQQAQQVITAVRPHLEQIAPDDRAVLQEVIGWIEKVIADETTTDAQGQVIERTAKHKGSVRIMSATDPQATLRKHGDSTILGYNATISVTATRIVTVTLATGCDPDQNAPVATLEQQQRDGRPHPAILIMDQAGGFGKTRARVETVSNGQTQMVARVPQAGGADPTRFGPCDFRIVGWNEDGTPCLVRCPNDVLTTRLYRHGGGEAWTARFLVSQCAGCPLWDQCRAPNAKPTSHRSVTLSDYHVYERDARVFNATDEGQALLKSRWVVEPTISWLVRYNGCRRARRVGQQAASCQLCNACAVRNIQMWLKRVDRGQAPPPPPLE